MTKTTWNATNKTKYKEKSHKYCNATIVEQNILDSAYGMHVNWKSTKFGICQNHQHSIYHFPSINGEVKSKYKKLGSSPHNVLNTYIGFLHHYFESFTKLLLKICKGRILGIQVSLYLYQISLSGIDGIEARGYTWLINVKLVRAECVRCPWLLA